MDRGRVASTGLSPGSSCPPAPSGAGAYRQEFYRGEAEDLAEVVRLDAAAKVPYGSFESVLVIREWTPLEPEVVEQKYYARGVGFILEEKVAGGEGRVALISFEPGK
ncbi:MAG: hypothetical protein ACR2HN_02265 [Tepidiformaceae bacterium]